MLMSSVTSDILEAGPAGPPAGRLRRVGRLDRGSTHIASRSSRGNGTSEARGVEGREIGVELDPGVSIRPDTAPAPERAEDEGVSWRRDEPEGREGVEVDPDAPADADADGEPGVEPMLLRAAARCMNLRLRVPVESDMVDG